MKKLINLERWIKNKTIREWTEALIFAFIVAFVFRTWLYAPFRVPSGSMIPTIQQGDHLFANMHAYGFVVPFTDYKFGGDDVKKGDVIIFPRPTNPEVCNTVWYSTYDTVKSLTVPLLSGIIGIFADMDEPYEPTCMDFIKRAVALEGDRLIIDGEDVYINGKREEGYDPFYDAGYPPNLKYIDIVIPEGKAFAMGDNRRNSNDSREWGYVEMKNIRARGSMIYLSFDPEKPFFLGLRTERIGIFF